MTAWQQRSATPAIVSAAAQAVTLYLVSTRGHHYITAICVLHRHARRYDDSDNWHGQGAL